MLRIRVFILLFFLVSPLFAEEPDSIEKSQKYVRFICMESLAVSHDVLLVHKNSDDKWMDVKEFELSTPRISEWIGVKNNNYYLVTKNGTNYNTLCEFNYPERAQRILVLLIPDKANMKYNPVIIDPAKISYVKGSTLVMNYSKQNSQVSLGSSQANVNSKTTKVIKAIPDPNGMYRLLVSYEENNKKILQYDTYTNYNDNARQLIVLLPGKDSGINVFKLTEFGGD